MIKWLNYKILIIYSKNGIVTKFIRRKLRQILGANRPTASLIYGKAWELARRRRGICSWVNTKQRAWHILYWNFNKWCTLKRQFKIHWSLIHSKVLPTLWETDRAFKGFLQRIFRERIIWACDCELRQTRGWIQRFFEGAWNRSYHAVRCTWCYHC